MTSHESDRLIAYLRDFRDLDEATQTYTFQEEIEPGDHYARWIEDIDCMVYGEVLEPEYPEDKDLLDRFRYIRLVRAYSVECPRGELGTENIAHMVPLEPDEFEIARESGWDNHAVVAMAASRALAREQKARENN